MFRKTSTSLPDISNGLGKRQEARDIVALEKFASKSADWMVLDNCLYIYRGPCWIKLQNEKSAVREIRRVFWQHESICESFDVK